MNKKSEINNDHLTSTRLTKTFFFAKQWLMEKSSLSLSYLDLVITMFSFLACLNLGGRRFHPVWGSCPNIFFVYFSISSHLTLHQVINREDQTPPPLRL